MKIKSTAIALAACATALSATFVGCGEEPATETTASGESAKITSIPVTDSYSYDISKLNPEGYSLFSLEGMEIKEENETFTGYCSENSNVPYIIVYHDPKNGKTLEERVDDLTADYSGDNAYYQITEDSDVYGGLTFASYYHSSEVSRAKNYIKEGYYYVTCNIIDTGDEFVEIDYFHKSEEVELGDSGKKMWVPTGYSNLITDDLTQSGVLLFATYNNYPIPDILIRDTNAEDNYSFEIKQALYNRLFEGDYTSSEIEEVFNAGTEKEWNEEANKDFLAAMGCEVELYKELKTNDLTLHFIRFTKDETTYESNWAILPDNKIYGIIIRSDLTPFPAFSAVLMESVH